MNRYFIGGNKTLGQRLDEAYADYKNSDKPLDHRKEALAFMLYVFDIPFESIEEDLNAQLAEKMSQLKQVKLEMTVTQLDAIDNELDRLMTIRKEHEKKGNSHYVPMRCSGPYQFNTKAKRLEQIANPTPSDDQEIQKALNQRKLLDVNQKDKEADVRLLAKKKCHFLTDLSRAKYNIEIYNGQFYQRGVPFDTTAYRSHRKKGYAAFTLNTNGELSVFNHLGGNPDPKDGNKILIHSSMNAGAPVLIAGEMEIREGHLISINTYSGHYQPSLYSIGIFLRYLCSKGMDVASTQVFLANRPESATGLQAKKVFIKGDKIPWYQVSASTLVTTIDQLMERHIRSAHHYRTSFNTWLYNFFGSPVTWKKIELVLQFDKEIGDRLQQMRRAANDEMTPNDEMKLSLAGLKKIIEKYSQENQKIDPRLGRLGERLKNMQDKITKVQQEYESDSYENREKCFKRTY